MHTLSVADLRIFMNFMISQGYDLWLTQAFYPTHVARYLPKMMEYCRNPILLKKVKNLIERSFCNQQKIVIGL